MTRSPKTGQVSDALWVKRGDALVAADHATRALLSAIKDGDWTRTSVPTLPRNPKHHRLMMAILTKVVEHTWPRFADTDELMDWLKIKSGMVKEVYVAEGLVKIVLPSISFMSMDEKTFKGVDKKWREIMCHDLLNGADPEDLLKEASQ